MIYCPYCDAETIEGADLCAQCGQPLADLHLPTPSNAVEKAVLRDRMQALSPRPPIVVPPDMPVRDVLQLLVDQRIGCLFVREDDQVVGVFSERDALLRLGCEASQLADRPVSDFMTPYPESLPREARVAFAIRMMDQGGYRHVLLVDRQGKPDGVTSVRDILAYLTKQLVPSS